jgi:hypothetical protein
LPYPEQAQLSERFLVALQLEPGSRQLGGSPPCEARVEVLRVKACKKASKKVAVRLYQTLVVSKPVKILILWLVLVPKPVSAHFWVLGLAVLQVLYKDAEMSVYGERTSLFVKHSSSKSYSSLLRLRL